MYGETLWLLPSLSSPGLYSTSRGESHGEKSGSVGVYVEASGGVF